MNMHLGMVKQNRSRHWHNPCLFRLRVLLILNGFDPFFRPYELNAPELGIYVSAIAMLVTFGLVRFQRYVVRKPAAKRLPQTRSIISLIC